jgi:GNAT superfamily N-acetyltransferase
MNPVAKRVVADEARREDLETVLQLYAENEDQPTHVLDLPAALTIWRRFNIYPNYKLYVARTNDEVVGTLALLIMDNLARFGAKSGVVEDVIVARKWQRPGIGRLTMHFALEQCRALAKKHSQQQAASGSTSTLMAGLANSSLALAASARVRPALIQLRGGSRGA